MAVEITLLGLQKPDGYELVRNGDNAISANAQKTEDLITEDRGRLAAIEGANVTQDNRLTVVESESTMQEATLTNHTSRIGAVETKNTAQDTDIATARTNAVADAKTYTDGQVATDRGRISTIETTAVFNGDARLLTVGDVEGVFFGITDSSDKQTALMLGMDGDLTPYAASRVAKSVGLSDVELDSGQKFAVVDADDRIIFSDTSTTATTSAALPVLDWAHWGDSMTDDEVTGLDSWTVKLSAMTGRNHFNGGWYSQRHENIAARQGGLPALVTVAGNVTASSGATTITAIINKPVLQSGSRTVHGTLAGVPGIMQEAVSGTVTFTPDTPGTYAVPAKSAFTPTEGAAYRDRHVTLWSGRNSIYDTDPQLVVASIRAMIDYLSPNVKRAIVMEIPPANTDSGATRTLTAAVNAAIKAAFPACWLPIATWLRSDEAATAAGITYTAQDLTDIANGDTPTSFRSDNIHLNAAGCTAVAYRVHQEAQKRGWL